MIETIAAVTIDQGVVSIVQLFIQVRIIYPEIIIFVFFYFFFPLLSKEQGSVTEIDSTMTQTTSLLLLLLLAIIIIVFITINIVIGIVWRLAFRAILAYAYVRWDSLGHSSHTIASRCGSTLLFVWSSKCF